MDTTKITNKIYILCEKKSVNCGHNMERDIIELITKDPWDISKTHPFFNTLKEAEDYCKSIDLDEDHILEITNCNDDLNEEIKETGFIKASVIINDKDNEITRLQKENLSALDQINKWSDEYVKLQKYNNSLENKVQQLLKERQDIGKMQQVMNGLNLQRNKNKKGIILPGGNRII